MRCILIVPNGCPAVYVKGGETAKQAIERTKAETKKAP